LHRAGAETAAALIAVTSQEEQNFKACRLGRDRFGIPNLIALAHDPDLAAQMSEHNTSASSNPNSQPSWPWRALGIFRLRLTS
jgi:Trk K+ transport system NAD-binding subunit